MLIDAEIAIKRLNTRKAKLDEIFSFEKTTHDKIRFGYDKSNKTIITHQNLTIVEKKGN
jgi:thymidylate kinase